MFQRRDDTHILNKGAEHFWLKYQNKLVGNLRQTPREFLFARFAWAVIFAIESVVCSHYGRSVVQLISESNSTAPGWTVRNLSGEALFDKYGGGGSKEAAPFIKRKTRGRVRKIGDGSSDDDDAESEDS